MDWGLFDLVCVCVVLVWVHSHVKKYMSPGRDQNVLPNCSLSYFISFKLYYGFFLGGAGKVVSVGSDLLTDNY